MAVLNVWDGNVWQPVAGGVASLSSGSITSGYIANNAVVSGSIASGQISTQHFASGAVYSGGGLNFHNYIANGGMWFASLYNLLNGIAQAGSNNASGGDLYILESWKFSRSSGLQLNAYRWDQLTSGYSSGLDARYFTQWNPSITASSGSKFVVYQPLTATTSQDLDNKQLSFQAKLKTTTGGSGQVYRIGLLQTISGSAVDYIPNPIVTTAANWNATTSGTDPAWASGAALIAPATDCQLSPNWNVFTNSVNNISGAVNLIPAIWASTPIKSGQDLYMSEVGLYQD